MHYTRITWGIIFVLQVTIRHYEFIYIKTIGNLFALRISVYFCHYLVTGVIFFYSTIFLKSFINVILATLYLSPKRRGQGHQGAEEDDIFFF